MVPTYIFERTIHFFLSGCARDNRIPVVILVTEVDTHLSVAEIAQDPHEVVIKRQVVHNRRVRCQIRKMAR